MKVCLIYNVGDDKEQNWVNALNNRKISFDVVDIRNSNWLDIISKGDYDLVIGIPNGTISSEKQLFDERVYIIKHLLKIPIYPKFDELFVYENKRMLSYYLESYNIPHPQTKVFYKFEEAINFLSNKDYPIVTKSNIGASGSGVHIVKNKSQAISILKKTFKGDGYPRRSGPNLNKKGLLKRVASNITDLEYVKKRISHYRKVSADKEKSILIQEYIPHQYEWRTIKIGNSYISHQKVLRGDRASGSGSKRFIGPKIEMLKFVKNVAQKMGFESAAFDLYETSEGEFLVNEIQTYYGTPHYMEVEGVSGRYIDKNGEWIFEEGDFRENYTCDLRLEHAFDLLKQKKI